MTADRMGGTSAASVRGRPEVLLRVAHLSKTFAGAKALDDVSLEVAAGEVLAIVGQNGSGKSTLVKLLAGLHQPDAGGTIEVRDDSGRLVALGKGDRRLHFIHQDLGLLPSLSTTENLDLGRPMGTRWITPLRARAEHARAADLIRPFGLDLDVRAPVALLSPAERAVVAIARALDGWQRPDNVLVLDEPTTAFHQEEVSRLFSAVRRVAASGAGIVFISHRLDEVHALADRVLVLRDGREVAAAASGHLDNEALVNAIVGSDVADSRRPPDSDGPVVLAADGLRGKRVHGITFQVRAGEIVGVSGVLGSGREHLNALLFGAERPTRGQVTVGGTAIPAGDMPTAIELGVAFVPADRHRFGAVMPMTVRENLTLPGLRGLQGRLGAIRSRSERAEAGEWIDRVELRPAAPEKPLLLFSGGNQQKVVLAKWLRTRPRVLLLDEPTQGVDVGAKAAIYRLVQQAAADGTATVLSSSDAKELAMVCNRVLLVEQGQVVGELRGEALTEAALVHAALSGPVSNGSVSHASKEGPAT